MDDMAVELTDKHASDIEAFVEVHDCVPQVP